MANAKFILGQTGGQIDFSVVPATPSNPSAGYVTAFSDGSSFQVIDENGNPLIVGVTGPQGETGPAGTTGAPGATGSVSLEGENYIVVEVTASATTNGTNFVSAYNAAKSKTPYGNALAAANRVSIIVPPGTYNFGATGFTCDTNFIDIIGQTDNFKSQILRVTTETPCLIVACNSITIKNLSFINTFGGGYGASFNAGTNRPQLWLENCFAPVFGDSGISGVVREIYNGADFETFSYSFYVGAFNATAMSGTFGPIFGPLSLAFDGACTGNFISVNITGTGTGANGIGSRGFYGTSNGFFLNCSTKGDMLSFNFQGTAINCHSPRAFAVNDATFTGTLINSSSRGTGTSFNKPIAGRALYCFSGATGAFASGATGSGKIRLCIDGNFTEINAG
jgi:hypothetical protein